jgi:hypothetical protein
MFCPLSADWGNVADWAGAIASLAAVIAALFIAFRESWSLKKQRQLDESQQYLKRKRPVCAVTMRDALIDAPPDDTLQPCVPHRT